MKINTSFGAGVRNLFLHTPVIVFVALFSLVYSETNTRGARCASSNGSGYCKPVSQCSQYPRMRLSGTPPVMCGFDDSGPLVCCPQSPSISSLERIFSSSKTTTERPVYSYENVQRDEPFNANRRQNEFFSTEFDDDDDDADYKKWSRPWGNNPYRPVVPCPDCGANKKPVRPVRKPSISASVEEFGNDNSRSDTSFLPDPVPSGWDTVNRQEQRPWESQGKSTTEEPFFWDDPVKNQDKKNNKETNYGFKPTLKRISEMKCDEYSEIVNQKSGRPDPIGGKSSNQCQQSALQLIVGGRAAEFGEFPHMAALGYRSGGKIYWECGGTLISEDFVMTAAHCLKTRIGDPVIVRLGVLNLLNSEGNPQDYEVAHVILHPNYRTDKQYNDIALIRLRSSVEFSKNVRPACLHSQDSIPVNKAVASGWGRLDTVGQTSAHSLQKVDLLLMDNQKCNQLFQDAFYPQLNKGIAKEMLCANEDGKDTCSGDSGGPLQYTKKGNKCVYYVIGVTSFGKSTCAAKNSAGVYSRVSSYLHWIENKVWPERK